MIRSGLHPKIVKCIDEMMSDMVLMLYYYGEFCQFINFEESKDIKRMGVNTTSSGMVCYWNREFVDKTPQKHINFIIIHEICHLLYNHPKRTRRGGYGHELSNIAQDMCINQAIHSDMINTTNHSKDFLELPTRKIEYDNKIEDEVWVLMMPKEYKGNHVFEEVYEWLKEEKEKYKDWKEKGKSSKSQKDDQIGQGNTSDEKGNQGQSQGQGNQGNTPSEKSGQGNTPSDEKGKQGQGNGKPSQGQCPVSDYLKGIFDGMDDGIKDWLDSHLESELTEEFRKELIDSVQRYLRSRGLEKGNIKSMLNKLQKSRKDYLREIKTALSTLRGYNKEKSISKRNRRSIPGVKGRIKEGFGLNVILDVSGSMGGYFEKALSYIFQNKIVINLIQCDTEVRKQGKRDYLMISNKRDFKKVQILGLGGTSLQPAINFIVNNKQINTLNTLILTDGETEALDVSKLKKTLILTVKRPCPIINGRPRQIHIDEDIPSEKKI